MLKAAGIDNLTKPDESSPPWFSFPAKIQVQTVNRCNYVCPMCPYPETSQNVKREQMPGELFHRIVDDVGSAQRTVKLCLMLQNEPFLDPRFFDFLDYAHRAGDAIGSISTVTNGSLLSESMLDRLMSYENFYLTISVNATDAERYVRIHGRDFWKKIHERLTTWQGARSRVRLSFVLDGSSVGEAREFQTYWRSLGYATRLIPINSRIDDLSVDRVHSIDESYGHCHYPVDTLNVLPDGGVILCCNDWQHRQTFGSLQIQTISEIWQSPALREFREAAIRGTLRQMSPCNRCDYPIRSSERVRLEAMVATGTNTVPSAQLGITSHSAKLHLEEGQTLTGLVWNLQPDRGRVSILLPLQSKVLSGRVRFELRIGHSGEFNFGSLEPIFCPGTIRFGEVFQDMQPAEIDLDQNSEAFRFFRWYCTDWTFS